MEPFVIPPLFKIAHFPKVNTVLMSQFCASDGLSWDIELQKSSLLLQRISPCNFSLRNTKRFCSRGLFFRAGFQWPVNCRLLGRGLVKRYRTVFDGLNAHWAGEYKLTTGHMK
jgi:hypothetical protein